MVVYKRKRNYAWRKKSRIRSYKRKRDFSGSAQRKRRRIGFKLMRSLAEKKERSISRKFTLGTGSKGYHDTLYKCLLHDAAAGDTNTPTYLSSGTSGHQRNGNDIYSVGFRVRGVFTVPFDRRNTKIKMWLVEYNTAQGEPTTAGEWFENVTGNNMLDNIAHDRWKAKLLRTLRVKPRDLYIERGELTDSGSEASLYYDIWIPWRRHLSYKGNISNVPNLGCKERVALVMTPYDTVSAVTTDALITTHEQQVTFYFKDP